VAKKPDGVSWAEAACLGVAGRTSLLALEATGMKAGDKLLLVGGSGGCGMMACRWLRSWGRTSQPSRATPTWSCAKASGRT